MNRRIILLTILFFLPLKTVQSEFLTFKHELYKTGVGFYNTNENTAHLFFAGYDSNFDGIYDPELNEEPAFWVRIEYVPPTFLDIKHIMEFDDGFLQFPFRPAQKDNLLYIPFQNKIIICDLENNTIINDNFLEISASALSIFDNFLFISQRIDLDGDFFPDENIVIVYNLANNIAIDTLEAKTNVQQTLPVFWKGQFYLFVLNEGAFGANDSQLQVFKYANYRLSEIKVIDLGDTGNFMAIYDDRLAIVMNGSSEVHFLDLDNLEISKTYQIPTSDWNGPREIVFSGDNDNRKNAFGDFVISTYDNKLFSLLNNEIVELVEVDYKIESLGFIGSSLVALSAFDDYYNPSNVVYFFLNITSSVEEYNAYGIEVYPNPASEFLYIKNNSNDFILSIEIYDSNGMIVYNFSVTNNPSITAIHLNKLNLVNGIYFAKINTHKEIITKPFIFIR